MATDVTPEALPGIASTLTSSEGEASGFSPAAAPNAGTSTGLLSATMGAYTDTLADLVDASSNAAQKVRDSHGSFVFIEEHNQATLRQFGR